MTETVTPVEIPVENKCSRCIGSTCCTYTTEALGPLRSKADFDHVLWQISHDHVEVYRTMTAGTC